MKSLCQVTHHTDAQLNLFSGIFDQCSNCRVNFGRDEKRSKNGRQHASKSVDRQPGKKLLSGHRQLRKVKSGLLDFGRRRPLHFS